MDCYEVYFTTCGAYELVAIFATEAEAVAYIEAETDGMGWYDADAEEGYEIWLGDELYRDA